MKKLLALTLLLSFSAFAQEICPLDQSLTNLSEDFYLTITPKNDIKDEIFVESKNAEFSSDIGKSSGKINIAKGEKVKIIFTSEAFESEKEFVSASGAILVDGNLERVELYVDSDKERTITVKEFQKIVSQEFEISCLKK